MPDSKRREDGCAFKVFDVRLTWRPDSSKHPTGAAEIESILDRHPGYVIQCPKVYSTGDNGPGYVDEIHTLLILRRDPERAEG